MIRLFDAHCHLQDVRLAGDSKGCIHRAVSAGVAGMLCCSCEETDWQKVLQLAAQHPQVLPAIGIHPWWSLTYTSGWQARLRALLAEYPHVSIGEIGLDHAIQPRNDEIQLELFRVQMEIAHEYNRPVSLHCRKAWGVFCDLLRGGMPVPECGIVIHSYSGPVELISELATYNCYFSFSGTITFDTHLKVRNACRTVAADRLLLETDSPYMLPSMHDGVNEPSTLPYIASTASTLRGVSIEETAAVTTANAATLYSF